MKPLILITLTAFLLSGCTLYQAWVEAQLKDCLKAPTHEKDSENKNEDISGKQTTHLLDSDSKDLLVEPALTEIRHRN